jgi:hypothetical protein
MDISSAPPYERIVLDEILRSLRGLLVTEWESPTQ